MPDPIGREVAAVLPPDRRQPPGICRNCFATWRARRPRPPAVFCHHFGNAAEVGADGWTVIEAIGARELGRLRREDRL